MQRVREKHTDRQTERKRNGDKQRQADRQTESERQTETGREGRQTDIHTEAETERNSIVYLRRGTTTSITVGWDVYLFFNGAVSKYAEHHYGLVSVFIRFEQ